MKLLILLAIGPFAALLAFTTNWIALIPWRRASNCHWTERARVYHPVRGAAATNLWVMPIVLTLGIRLLWPEASPHWVLLAMTAALGALLGTLPMDREVFPRISKADLLRQGAVNWIIRFLMWGVFLGAIALMPEQFNLQTLGITFVVVGLLFWWNHDGWVYVGRKLGMFATPPERLHNIVRSTAAKMNVPYKDVWLLRSPLALAYAMPGSRRLLMSERLLELLTDDELSAVCAHELAHLTEKQSDYALRYLVWLIFLPWIFFTPLLHNLGMLGFFALLFSSVFVPVLFRKISHRLEKRADEIARTNEPDPGTYARALARLYEDNLLPAVNPKENATHPHLYDRLIDAGVTPDFPRPAPTKDLAPHGTIFASALGALAVITVARMLNLM